MLFSQDNVVFVPIPPKLLPVGAIFAVVAKNKSTGLKNLPALNVGVLLMEVSKVKFADNAKFSNQGLIKAVLFSGLKGPDAPSSTL